MEDVLSFIAKYNLPIFIIATSTIALVGILKFSKVFNKIKSADLKRAIYFIIDLALSFGGMAIYFAIFKIKFDSNYILISLKQVSATLALYGVYENVGFKKLVKIFTSWLANKIKNDPNSKVSKLVKKYGLDTIIDIATNLKPTEQPVETPAPVNGDSAA